MKAASPNRTFMELKCGKQQHSKRVAGGPNRTFMELKSLCGLAPLSPTHCPNRTFMELKCYQQVIILAAHKSQSHLYGIEI